MPIISTSTPSYGSIGPVELEEGYVVERYQAYAVVPTVAAASLTLLDPATQTAFSVPASAGQPKVLTAIVGVVENADITLASAGTIKISQNLTIDTTNNAASASAGWRNNAGTDLSGTTVPRGAKFLSTFKVPNGLEIVAPLSLNVFGASIPGPGATAVNLSTASATKPAIILITVMVLARSVFTQTAADYAQLPLTVRQLLTNPS